MIFPVAVATISTWPRLAHRSASTNSAIMDAPIARPIGEGGVSTISSAAGRNASSSRSRCLAPPGNGTIFFSAFMDACLKKAHQGTSLRTTIAHGQHQAPLGDRPQDRETAPLGYYIRAIMNLYTRI